jgi:hypothetical protein
MVEVGAKLSLPPSAVDATHAAGFSRDLRMSLQAVVTLAFLGANCLSAVTHAASPLVNLSIPKVQLHAGERIVGFNINSKNTTVVMVRIPREWTVNIDNSTAGPHLIGSIKVGAAALSASDLDQIVEFEEQPNLGPPALTVVVVATKDFEHQRDIALSTSEARLVQAPGAK